MLFFSKREVRVKARLALLIFGALVKILWERLAWGGVPFLTCLVGKRNRGSSGALVTYGRVIDWWKMISESGGWDGMVHRAV